MILENEEEAMGHKKSWEKKTLDTGNYTAKACVGPIPGLFKEAGI